MVLARDAIYWVIVAIVAPWVHGRLIVSMGTRSGRYNSLCQLEQGTCESQSVGVGLETARR